MYFTQCSQLDLVFGRQQRLAILTFIISNTLKREALAALSWQH
jgi:hypothetical protein